MGQLTCHKLPMFHDDDIVSAFEEIIGGYLMSQKVGKNSTKSSAEEREM